MSRLSSALQAPVLLFVAAVLTGSVLLVQSYPTGAGSQACPAQSPEICHKGSPQSSAPPYSLVVKDTSYSPGKTVNVTLQVTNGGKPFMGFLVGAHRTQGDTKEYLGSFTLSDDNQPQCGANGNTGATHRNNTLKTSVVFIWTPPSTIEGALFFRAAVVQNFSTYWVNISSGELKPRDYPPANQTTTTPPQPSTSHFMKDPECGKTKACYGDCKDDLCSFEATWYKADESLVVSLKSVVNSADNVWAALGFGMKAKMNPASVSECVAYDGAVQAFTAYNKDYSNTRVDPNPKLGLSNVSGSVSDGVFTCTFRRQLIVSGGAGHVYNLTTPFHILMARGLASEWTVKPHGRADAFVTDDSYDVTAHVDIGARAWRITLVKLHGSLMTLAWILCGSIGVLAARFFKPVWSNQTLCGVKVWFAIHRLTMVVAFLATVAGYVIIFIHVGGWSEIHGLTYQKIHPILGTIVTALTVINPVMAVFRCEPRHHSRPVFNWAHFLVGSSAYILGVTTVGIGVNMPLTDIPDYVTMCVIGFGAWHVMAHVILELTKHCERNDSAPKILRPMNEEDYPRNPEYVNLIPRHSDLHSEKYHLFRQTVFTLHIFIAIGVCVAVVCSIIRF